MRIILGFVGFIITIISLGFLIGDILIGCGGPYPSHLVAIGHIILLVAHGLLFFSGIAISACIFANSAMRAKTLGKQIILVGALMLVGLGSLWWWSFSQDRFLAPPIAIGFDVLIYLSLGGGGILLIIFGYFLRVWGTVEMRSEFKRLITRKTGTFLT